MRAFKPNTRTVVQLENTKHLRHPMFPAALIGILGVLSIVFYRQCVDYLQLSQQLVLERHTPASLSMEVIKPLCSWIIVLMAMVLPLFTTLSISQEYRQNTFSIWSSSTLHARQIVLGKFISLLVIIMIFITWSLSMIACLQLETSLDWGLISTSLLAVFLTGCSFLSFGLFISSLFSNPIWAMSLTLLCNLFWMLLEWLLPFAELSLLSHADHLLHGIFYSTDVLYYCLFSGFWLSLTTRVLDHKMKHYS
jgi:ABC-2 type transport system permease protein